MPKLNFTLLALSLTLAGWAGLAQAASPDERVAAATEVLNQLNRMPEAGIPPHLLNRAYAVAVIPNVIKAGFIVGGSHGKGVLVVRRPDGRWSNPAFVSLTHGSFGWQVGAQASDLVLVFKSRKGVEGIASGKITLGGNASVAAGPVGRSTAAATDGQFRSEIYSYSRSRGFFAGISLDGGALSIDQEANLRYYESTGLTTDRILQDDSIPTPMTGRQFIETLAAMAPRLQWQAAPESRNAAAPPPAPPAGTRTYAIEEGPEPAPETLF